MKTQHATPAMTLAARIFALTSDEIERFEKLYGMGSRGKCFQRSFRSEAVLWRSSWRRELKTNKRCRLRYLHSICADPLSPETTMHEIPSAARYLCWRVEMEVRRMDERQAKKRK